MRELVAERRDHGVVVRTTVRAKHVRNHASGELSASTFRPFLKQAAAFLLTVAIRIVAFFLRRAGEQHMRRDVFRLHRLDQLFHEADVRVVDDLRIRVAVHRR